MCGSQRVANELKHLSIRSKEAYQLPLHSHLSRANDVQMCVNRTQMVELKPYNAAYAQYLISSASSSHTHDTHTKLIFAQTESKLVCVSWGACVYVRVGEA